MWDLCFRTPKRRAGFAIDNDVMGRIPVRRRAPHPCANWFAGLEARAAGEIHSLICGGVIRAVDLRFPAQGGGEAIFGPAPTFLRQAKESLR